MAEVVCNCPHCNQPITCDDAWAGQELQCPTCQKNFIAPGPAQPSPKPHGKPSSVATTLAQAQSRINARNAPKESGSKKWLAFAVIGLIVGVGAWYLLAHAGLWQEKFNEQTRKDAEKSGDSEAGHIANVYAVLDATDPDRRSSSRGSLPLPGRTGPSSRYSRSPATTDAEKEQPVIPAVWTLDTTAATIPEGRVNGMIGAVKFVCDEAHLEVVGNAVVLSLRQGYDSVPDRQLLVYLRPKAGEKLGGGSWTITKETKGTSVIQVVKQWKPNPQYAPTLKSFTTGYAMKLELSPIKNGELKGKIFIALPDTEHTVAAGVFSAETSLPDSPVAAAPTTATAPATAATKP